MTRRISRRDALLLGTAASLAVLTGCGDDPRPGPTTGATLGDADGDGRLTRGAGEPLIDRTALGGGGEATRVLAELAQLTDVHVRDAQSPGRVPFLDRFGDRFGSTFRPHELLSPHVLAAAVGSIRDAGPGPVFVSGDLVDSAQRNELLWATALLDGRSVTPNSGGPAYAGVQDRTGPDPAYYRPDSDAPRHPGLLARALEPISAGGGLGAPWYPALGNHDVLVQGEIAATDATRAAATGTRLLRSLEVEALPEDLDGLTAERIDALLAAGLPGDAIEVPADPNRTQLGAPEVIGRLRRVARSVPRLGDADRLDYATPVGDDLLVIVLDLARRDRGAEGFVTEATTRFLRRSLDGAGERYVVVVTHQPLGESEGAAPALALLDADPRVVATLAGHRHVHRVDARRTPAGGYWDVRTASLADSPQQWRALRLVETSRGVALEAWVVDHAGRSNDDDDLAGIARDLAFLDAQGGRPAGAAGRPADRNVRLHLPRRPRRAPTSRPAAPAVAPRGPAEQGPGFGDGFG